MALKHDIVKFLITSDAIKALNFKLRTYLVYPAAYQREGMSLGLLKFSGGSVDDYAICRSS
jgi:hypothetical protein